MDLWWCSISFKSNYYWSRLSTQIEDKWPPAYSTYLNIPFLWYCNSICCQKSFSSSGEKLWIQIELAVVRPLDFYILNKAHMKASYKASFHISWKKNCNYLSNRQGKNLYNMPSGMVCVCLYVYFNNFWSWFLFELTDWINMYAEHLKYIFLPSPAPTTPSKW